MCIRASLLLYLTLIFCQKKTNPNLFFILYILLWYFCCESKNFALFRYIIYITKLTKKNIITTKPMFILMHQHLNFLKNYRIFIHVYVPYRIRYRFSCLLYKIHLLIKVKVHVRKVPLSDTYYNCYVRSDLCLFIPLKLTMYLSIAKFYYK